MTNLLITARYGLYGYSDRMDEPVQILSNQDVADSRLFPSRGIFGITALHRTSKIMIACRVVRRFPWFGKHSNAKKLYIVDPCADFRFRKKFLLRGIRDIHQISSHRDLVFLADANMDRVLCYNFRNGNRAGVIYANPERDGHNHLNTVLAHDGSLYIGLNKGTGGSKIMKLDLDEIRVEKPFTIRAYKRADIHTNTGIQDTHDLVPYEGSFLSTASGDGFVFDVLKQEPLFEVSDWPRGLSVTENGIWAGSSEVAKRSERHRRTDGVLHLFDHDTFERLKKVPVPDSGQIYDLLTVPDRFF